MGSNTGATQQKKQDLLVKLLLAVAVMASVDALIVVLSIGLMDR